MYTMEQAEEAILSLEEIIVQKVHEIFEGLPMKCKPRDLHHPKAEWIPLSAIALVCSQYVPQWPIDPLLT